MVSLRDFSRGFLLPLNGAVTDDTDYLTVNGTERTISPPAATVQHEIGRAAARKALFPDYSCSQAQHEVQNELAAQISNAVGKSRQAEASVFEVNSLAADPRIYLIDGGDV